MGRRRARAPEVLRRAYGDCACTLREAILSPVPSPPPSPAVCRCRGRLCFFCGVSWHLLRDDDPVDYKALLTRAFCVVSPNAPRPPAEHRNSGLPQHTIVRNSMELMMDNSQVSTNVLCNGYHKQNRFNDVGESLCTCSWDLLLNRVTGSPLDTLLENSDISCTIPTNQQSSCMGDNSHCGLKRKIIEECPMVDAIKKRRLFSWQRRKLRQTTQYEKIASQCFSCLMVGSAKKG